MNKKYKIYEYLFFGIYLGVMSVLLDDDDDDDNRNYYNV